MYDLTFPIIFIFLVVFFIMKKENNKFDKSFLIILYGYHLIFAYIYYKMSLNGGADASIYYEDVFNNLEGYNERNLFLGTFFIKHICYVLIKYLHLSYLNVALVFSTVGYFGLYILYKLLFKDIDKKYFVLLFFIPSLHFWTVGVGKDSLIFFVFAVFLYSLENRKIFLLLGTLVLAFILRNPVAVLLFASLSVVIIYEIYKLNISKGKKVLIYGLLFILSLCVIYFVFEKVFSMQRGISLQAIWDYIEMRQRQHLDSSSTVDIREYNIFMKLFTFLYRPFFESFDIRYLVLSFENLTYMILTFYILFNVKYIQINSVNIFNIVFIFLMTFLMSILINNMGIHVRFKTTMFLPFFFYLVAHIYKRKSIDSLMQRNNND